jgi:hypothetical protein
MRPSHLKALQAKSKRLKAQVLRPHQAGESFVVIVGSRSNTVLNQVVTVRFLRNGTIYARCTCQWAKHGGIACSHVLAALNVLAQEKKRRLSYWLTPEEARRQKKALFQLAGECSPDFVWITSRPADDHAA